MIIVKTPKPLIRQMNLSTLKVENPSGKQLKVGISVLNGKMALPLGKDLQL